MSADGPAVLADLGDDGVLVLTLSRPSRRNMWNAEMEEAYFDHLSAAADDPAVRAIVVTGAGHTFCPGVDPEALKVSAQGGVYQANRRPQTLAVSIPKLVIAAINGSVAGLGLVHALFADYRISDEGVKLATSFGRIGLPAEDGIAWILSRLIGPSKTMDMLLSSRVVMSEEALALGMVDRLTTPGTALEVARAYAATMASAVAPSSMAMIKAQVYADLSSTLEEARVRALHLLTVAKRQPDFQEGVRALVEGRQPQFASPSRLHL